MCKNIAVSFTTLFSITVGCTFYRRITTQKQSHLEKLLLPAPYFVQDHKGPITNPLSSMPGKLP